MNSAPTLKSVILSSDIIYGGIVHSLSTEHQEIMGLLIGSIVNNGTIANIKTILVLSRKDRQKDRVEVNYENLALASSIADEMTKLEKDENRIIGWYHSHPHITVQPSHVDVNTQGNYQMMDQGFLGLIFSVFDKNINGRIEICAFQSICNIITGSVVWNRVEIPITIEPNIYKPLQSRKLEHLITTLIMLINEEKSTFENYLTNNNINIKTNPLAYCRASTVFQNSLLRIIDLQIKPLQFAFNSKIKSLQLKKEYLQSRLNSNKNTILIDIDRTDILNKISRRVNVLSAVCTPCNNI